VAVASEGLEVRRSTAPTPTPTTPRPRVMFPRSVEVFPLSLVLLASVGQTLPMHLPSRSEMALLRR
jgi:hypothetical protein